MNFPSMVKIRQHFNTTMISDIPAEIHSEFVKLGPQNTISPGRMVAITAGSRGIYKISEIIKALVSELRSIGAKPFIVPAMGSHGGATVEGQKEILNHYGITEELVGAPIKASMEVTRIGETPDGIPVFIDKIASQADHIVVVNRVKPHTDFVGDLESGLMKMMAIGLGKQAAADLYHNEFIRFGHFPIIISVARTIIENSPIAFGIAVVENQRDETHIIKFIPPREIEETEKELLVVAKRLLPTIPFDEIDILIVNEMGKNISGAGIDQNVIGRTVIPYHVVPDKPHIGRIIVRDLTPDSDGNACGIGNVDFTTKRLVDKIDLDATNINAITSSCPESVRIPPYYNSDLEILSAAFKTIPVGDPKNARIVHIQNSLRLEDLYISEAMIPEAQDMKDISVIGEIEPMEFDQEDNLPLSF